MGGDDVSALVGIEPTLEYHPDYIRTLTLFFESRHGKVSGRQFDWGGHLLKSNGGALRFPQYGR